MQDGADPTAVSVTGVADTLYLEDMTGVARGELAEDTIAPNTKLSGLYAIDSLLDIRDSSFTAAIIGDLTGGAGGKNNGVTAGLFGLHAVNSSTVSVLNSTITAQLMVKLTGSGHSATANLRGLFALNSSVEVEDSTIPAQLTRDLTGGDGGSDNDANASLSGLVAVKSAVTAFGNTVAVRYTGNATDGAGGDAATESTGLYLYSDFFSEPSCWRFAGVELDCRSHEHRQSRAWGHVRGGLRGRPQCLDRQL